jgi:hypothetical protein
MFDAAAPRGGRSGRREDKERLARVALTGSVAEVMVPTSQQTLKAHPGSSQWMMVAVSREAMSTPTMAISQIWTSWRRSTPMSTAKADSKRRMGTEHSIRHDKRQR